MADNVPKGLGKRGKQFYSDVTDALDLEVHEAALLEEACRTLDRLDALHAAIERSGYLTPDGRVVPAVTEARQQQITLSRLIASIRLPDDFSASYLDRGQRRGGARGTYILKEVLREKAN